MCRNIIVNKHDGSATNLKLAPSIVDTTEEGKYVLVYLQSGIFHVNESRIMLIIDVSVEIPSDKNREERSKRLANTTERENEVIHSSGSNASNLLDAANVRRRRSRNRKKRKNISQQILIPDNPEGQQLPP